MIVLSSFVMNSEQEWSLFFFYLSQYYWLVVQDSWIPREVLPHIATTINKIFPPSVLMYAWLVIVKIWKGLQYVHCTKYLPDEIKRQWHTKKWRTKCKVIYDQPAKHFWEYKTALLHFSNVTGRFLSIINHNFLIVVG